MKKIIAALLVLCLVLSFLPMTVFAGNGATMEKAGAVDTVNGNDFTVYDEYGKESGFSYTVPQNGAAVLIFFSSECAYSQNLFSMLNDCDWLSSPNISVTAVEVRSRTMHDLITFRSNYIPDKGKYINFRYSKNDLMWAYYSEISPYLSLTWPLVLVISENGGTRTIEYGEDHMTSVAKLYNSIAAVCGSFADSTENPYETVSLNVEGIHNYADANKVLELVNKERAAEGLSPLILDTALTEAAMQRAAECAVRYDHDRPTDESCFTILDGILPDGSAAENIAYGYGSAEAVMQGWMDSSGHRSNILRSNMTHIGVGMAQVNGVNFWVQLFHDNAPDKTSANYTQKQPQVFRRNVDISAKKLVYPKTGTADINVEAKELGSAVNYFKVSARYQGAARQATVIPAALSGEQKEISVRDGNNNVIATMWAENDGYGTIAIRPKASGSAVVELPLYDGQKNPFKLTVNVTVKGQASGNNGSAGSTGNTGGNVDVSNIDCKRIYGSNRYETAFKAADELKALRGGKQFDSVIIACGTNFADALAGSYLAAVKDAPILLVNPSMVNKVTNYVKSNLKAGGTVYILGGKNAVPESMEAGLGGFEVKRFAGSNRYETNLLILKEAGVGDKDILVATGTNFADSLSASATGKPILLVGAKLTSAQKQFLAGTKGTKYILGGTNAVSAGVESELRASGTVRRLGGANRYATSVLIAETFFSAPKSAVLSYAQNFPDGLCGGVIAYKQGAPMLLVTDSGAKAADTYAAKCGIKNGYVLGGTGLISDATMKTIFS